MYYVSSAYGEGISMGIQTVTIAAQVLHYNYSSSLAAAFVAVYSIVCYMMTTLVPVDILWNLQAVTIPVLLFGKVKYFYSTVNGLNKRIFWICVIFVFLIKTPF